MTRAKEEKPQHFFGLLVYPLSRTIMGARGGRKGIGLYHPCAGLIIIFLKQLAFLHKFLNLSLHITMWCGFLLLACFYPLWAFI